MDVLIIGLGLFCLELYFLCKMDSPSLVIRLPILSLDVDFLGVCFPILGILLLPLFFYLPILKLFASFFLTITLYFTFSLVFPSSWRSVLEVIGKFGVIVF